MKKDKLIVSLHDKDNVKELLKRIYPDNEVKDDSKDTDTVRVPGANGVSAVDELSPDNS